MVTRTAIGTRLLLDTADGVFELIRTAAGDWERHHRLAQPQRGQRFWGGRCLTCDADGQTLYLGTGDGVWRSRDQGLTWLPASQGLRLRDVWGIEAHPARPGTIFAGTKPAAIFRSDDFGETWHETDLSRVPERDRWMFPIPPHTPQARAFAFDPRDPDWIYAGVEEGGILLSRDGGHTWEDRSVGLTWSDLSPTPKADVHTILIDPFDPDRVHTTLGNGYHLSVDRGQTWERRMTGLTPRYTRAIGVDRIRPGHLFVGTSEIPPSWMEHSLDAPQFADAGGRLFETHDYGERWEPVTNGFPERLPHLLTTIEQDRVDPQRWYAASVGGALFESEDGGASWRLAAEGLPAILDLECMV